jgi:hypothetical protein
MKLLYYRCYPVSGIENLYSRNPGITYLKAGMVVRCKCDAKRAKMREFLAVVVRRDAMRILMPVFFFFIAFAFRTFSHFFFALFTTFWCINCEKLSKKGRKNAKNCENAMRKLCDAMRYGLGQKCECEKLFTLPSLPQGKDFCNNILTNSSLSLMHRFSSVK